MRLRRRGGTVEGPECALHKRHAPVNLSTEFHHVVPVAWQLMWQPAQPWPFPGNDPDGRGKLWDDRGVTICPTGHRNVHVWIVRLMHTVPSVGENIPAAENAVRKLFGLSAHGIEYETATLALTRWQEAGGSLTALANAGEWGES